MRKTVFCWLVLVIALLSTSVFAHQQKISISKVLFNPRTDNIEVMHRFNIHDAEHAVKQLFGKHADILNSTDTQDRFADYVAKRFFIYDQQDHKLPLQSVGYELDGKFLWVYQETPQPEGLSSLKVRHMALRDMWTEQINTVNIEGLGAVKTLTFDQNVELLQVSF